MKTIILCIENESISLPVNYNNMIQGLIYTLISEDQEYADVIHEHGFELGERKYKLFTFGQLEGKCRFAERKLHFSSDINLEIRFADDHMAEIVFNRLLRNPSIRIGSHNLNVVNLQISENLIMREQIMIRMKAPLTIHSTSENKMTHYYSPGEPEFRELILQNLSKKYFAAYGEPYVGVLDFVPLKVSAADKVVTSFKGIMITGWKGDYYMEADRKLLNFAYYSGLGDRNSQGFGMFEIISK